MTILTTKNDKIVSMGKAKPGKEAERLYERIYGKKNLGFNGNADLFGSAEEYGDWNNQLSQDGENGERDVQGTQSERREYNASGSGSNLLESNNGKSIINEPSSNDGGFSSMTGRNHIADYCSDKYLLLLFADNVGNIFFIGFR